jgi:hypothetical protein
MSRPPIPFKSADGPPDPDPFRRSTSPAPSLSDRPFAQPNNDLIAIHEIRGSQDALEAFDTESELPPDLKQSPRAGRRGGLAIAAALVVVAGILALTILALKRPQALSLAPAVAVVAPVTTGLAQFDSRPSGADVVVDGVLRGKTPLKLSLPVGAHALEIRSDAGTRSLPLTIEAGILISQYVELLAGAERTTGRLDVTSDPPGAQIKIDGVTKGVTPLTLDAVEPGEHTVSLSRNGVSIVRTVKVAAGTTGSVMASLGATPATAAAVGGWIALSAPFELQVFEEGRLIGTTSTERLMVPAGRHQLDLVNAAFNFRSSMSVDVQAGKVAAASVTLPTGSLSVNALPWAEVWVDGRSSGTTPLANLAVPIGSHEIVLRHPQLGERRRTVTITSQTPVRIGVDFAQ